MYVFFDKNGVIREIVNDKPVRVGSQNANKIYFYFDQVTPYDVFVTIQWSNGDKTPETSILLNQETKEIPYNKNRDLKYFKDYKLYNFYYYEIENVASNGLAEATVRMMENENSLFAQGLLTFNIENGIIKDDYFINQSQFDYLIKQMGKVDQNSLLAFNKAVEVQQIALDKPMVYFENDFKNLVTVLSVSEQAKVGDIFVLLAENQPDFIVISEQSAQQVNYITISQYDIENDLVPFAEVGKVYKIENSNTFIIAIESGIQKPTVDKALNLYSENPVQNKVITLALQKLEKKIGAGGGNITVEQQVNDSTNPVSSKAVQDEFVEFSTYYDGEIENAKNEISQAVVKQVYFNDGATLDVAHNTDYHTNDNITNLLIRIPSGNILCSVMFKIVDSGDFNIEIMGSNGYIGKAPDFKNGETWELSIHNGIIASGKVVSE